MDEFPKIKKFEQHEVREALAYAADGGIAIHLHDVIPDRKRAPQCFVRAVDKGQQIAHVFCRDAAVLRAFAVKLGVRKIYIDREGVEGQHIDLCAQPLRRALGFAEHRERKGQQ